MTVSQIYRRLLDSYYGRKKEHMERQFLLYRYVYRPCSFPLSTLFILLGVSANQVSMLNVLLLLVTLSIFAFGGSGSILLASALYFLFYVLDFADGNIARFHGTPSYFGKLLDGVIDTLGFLVFAVVGVANTRDGLGWFPSDVELTLAIGTSIGALIQQNYRFRLAYLKREKGLETGDVTVNAIKGALSRWRQIGATLQWLQVNVAVSAPVALLIFSAFDALSAFIAVFFALYCLVAPAEIILSLVRNKALMREYREI